MPLITVCAPEDIIISDYSFDLHAGEKPHDVEAHQQVEESTMSILEGKLHQVILQRRASEIELYTSEELSNEQQESEPLTNHIDDDNDVTSNHDDMDGDIVVANHCITYMNPHQDAAGSGSMCCPFSLLGSLIGDSGDEHVQETDVEVTEEDCQGETMDRNFSDVEHGSNDTMYCDKVNCDNKCITLKDSVRPQTLDIGTQIDRTIKYQLQTNTTTDNTFYTTHKDDICKKNDNNNRSKSCDTKCNYNETVSSQSHRGTRHRPANKTARISLDIADLHKHGRLVVYFRRSRSRSLSPSYRSYQKSLHCISGNAQNARNIKTLNNSLE